MYDDIWPRPQWWRDDTEWAPVDPEDEIEDMDYPVDTTSAFAEILHIELSIEPYFEVDLDIRATA